VRLLDENELAERAVAVISAMARLDTRLSDTQGAFDSVATDYARANAENPILREMRQRVMAAVSRHVASGGRILDLGCGPGTDAETLADAGYTITAIDWSSAMVDETRRRIASRGLQSRAAVQQLGIHELDQLAGGPFDAACSNFGPLNCVADLPRAARLIAEQVRSGGTLIASVIGRVCPWEIALHSLRGDWPRVRVRFADGPVAVPLNGGTVWTTYYAPRTFEKSFAAAGFRRVELRALGLFVPPPYLEAFSARHPSVIQALQRVEDRMGGVRGLRSMGDHFLIVMRKVG
jgi:SAM-dependent methyltransferase